MKIKTEELLLIGSVGLIILLTAGSAIAQSDTNDNDDSMNMNSMMREMNGNMNNGMIERMQEMMNNKEMRDKMKEHMTDCPMMKSMMD
ncbi:MAG: hypothetical protein J4428_03970 [Candidatus Aenigmarchaeota archaeon]|nr:hypothetical protein [Candidatus Aenigmarchaeota archaeon]